VNEEKEEEEEEGGKRIPPLLSGKDHRNIWNRNRGGEEGEGKRRGKEGRKKDKVRVFAIHET